MTEAWRTRIRWGLLACSVLLCGAPAGVLAKDDMPFEEKLDAFVAQADNAGLVGERLNAKAREGLAKGIPPERIWQVLKRIRVNMEQAKALLAKASPKALPKKQARRLTGILGQALDSRVDAEALQLLATTTLSTKQGALILESAADAAGDLNVRGFPPDEVQQLVLAAVRQGLCSR